MKKFLLLASVATFALASCNKSKCPTYSSTKSANRVSSPIMASTASTISHQ
ncbi:hypothetical protein [Hymenobacter sp. DG25A]|uniref:hypothetical protein n=1 Tax=Hymenobacter sp. DG25A TaxID=1385663 RepID=UPI000A45B4E2|nr:hypothetical protein [Hymenobacter sp. DG25A]